MFKELKPGFMMMVVMTVLTGLVYPAVVTVDGSESSFAIRPTAA